MTRKSFKFIFVTFKPLSYCFEEIIGFQVEVSFARRPVSRLIKPGDITKEFLKKGYFSWIENYKLNLRKMSKSQNDFSAKSEQASKMTH